MYRTLRLRCLSRPQAIQLTPLPYVLPVFSRNVQTSSDPQTPNPPKARPPPLIDIVGPPSAHVNVKLRYQKEYGQYEPLPALPKAPPYPCPLLTQDELDTYLVPLYSRKWGITTLEKRNEDASRFHVRQLAAMFNFESDVDVKEFVTSISEIIKFENVCHCVMLLNVHLIAFQSITRRSAMMKVQCILQYTRTRQCAPNNRLTEQRETYEHRASRFATSAWHIASKVSLTSLSGLSAPSGAYIPLRPPAPGK
ncbi:hypothetical protein BD410DRAFT_836770 [Rickenella mellea]|uniref:4a-hydroxytetrahydrobiopterin dehydratase n=1 Tax=Rickenella mellea TaxID=50990 RepID=A0A4Y7QEJ6_9AGAM|nr:hypothetical protein BD410DRAFT_836770 [Rickenella mellea]